MIQIIPSTQAQGDRVIEIWRDAVDATHDFLTPEDRRAIDEEVCGFLSQAPLALAQSAAGEILGFMLVSPTDTGAHMDALFIDPAAHGQGLGRALVNHALARHDAITTDVNAQNIGAVKFYDAMGFIETGRSDRDDQRRPYPLIHLSRQKVLANRP
ncbi:acetyltransferase [Oceanicaulis sp. MMSF_3324]|uniref:acetyltransferase n=1 Tax=Oceanicaulis sp. MMSF_3324 TaxID=3046702 RepID=UPI00273EB38D|nr:acetyltransferase [Oceanicaulis sp. MMSF_3324]